MTEPMPLRGEERNRVIDHLKENTWRATLSGQWPLRDAWEAAATVFEKFTTEKES